MERLSCEKVCQTAPCGFDGNEELANPSVKTPYQKTNSVVWVSSFMGYRRIISNSALLWAKFINQFEFWKFIRKEVRLKKNTSTFNKFHATVLFLYPLKTLGNLRFPKNPSENSDASRGIERDRSHEMG